MIRQPGFIVPEMREREREMGADSKDECRLKLPAGGAGTARKEAW